MYICSILAVVNEIVLHCQLPGPLISGPRQNSEKRACATSGGARPLDGRGIMGGLVLRSSAHLMSLKKGCALISSAPALVPSLCAASRSSSCDMRSCKADTGLLSAHLMLSIIVHTLESWVGVL